VVVFTQRAQIEGGVLRSGRFKCKSYLAAFFSASSIFLMYLAASLLNFFRHDLQHSLISRPS
jgi:hypothetical protein